NYTASGHLQALASHIGPKLVDYCVVNKDPIPQERIKNYEQEGASALKIDKEAVLGTGCEVAEGSLLDKKSNYIHHDPAALASVIMNLISESKKTRPHAKRQQ
ncbi:MAG: 2-phospho-L-lactate transferase CofD family protein, partial [Candidatus Omnitrophica bacterium]|nr:2-phospho-L-lactate transferase CofD family protein [Candidatus Omnitrophota bacterium]